ncbi:MAG: hypothetical protein J2P46_15105 [Zavarzinella sp.]|nr:hypothetical protein [Zavarzinella sp.]
MLSLYRGLLGGLLVAGLAAVGASPLGAQAKKDPPKKDAAVVPKKDMKKDDARERSVSFATSDGLALNGYWFQGTAIEKQRPDAVLMFPAPGSKITDAWINLARALSEKNFSVLLFDWRGCGLNGPEAGSRIFESPERFWAETYNQRILGGRKAAIEDKGLDFKDLVNRGNGNLRYRDWLFNDLVGARYFLDKQSDNGKCNTNRVWIISEKEGSHMGLAFIATEFWRDSIYHPRETLLDTNRQTKSAGKDYAGMMALSYADSPAAASNVFANAIPSGNNSPLMKEARTHLEQRLATVLLYSKKEGASASKALVNRLRAGGTEDVMKRNFKYLREIDTKTSPVTGLAMLDDMDSFGARANIVEAMVEISKRQNFGKDATDREANKTTNIPRYQVEMFYRPRN